MMFYESYYGSASFDSGQLYHHGVKGQKWGVRRYQYPDGSLTEAGRLRYYTKSNQSQSGIKNSLALAVAKKYADRRVKDLGRKSIGRLYADSYIKTDVPLYRIQSNPEFSSFAFFATYKKHDTDMYSGLFGKNLLARANAEARSAERSGSDNAKELRDKANKMNIYQLELKNSKRLKLPSEDNAGHVVGKLLKDDGFRKDLKGSILDSAKKMLRPSQQLLFKEAQKLLRKDASKLTPEDKRVVYKALNLSLTNHNEQQVRMQDRFYGELKKHGYSALLDMNDRSFSSYHAKAPIIVFDVGNVKVSNIRKLSPNEINKKYAKYNRERLIKDIPEQLGGNLLRSIVSNSRRASDAREEALSRYLRQGDGETDMEYYGVFPEVNDRTLCIKHMVSHINLSRINKSEYYGVTESDTNLEHHGIKGQKWGIRRFQNPDGSLTAAGKQRYGTTNKASTLADRNALQERFAYTANERKLLERGRKAYAAYNKKRDIRQYYKYADIQKKFLDSIESKTITTNIKDKSIKAAVEQKMLEGGISFEGLYEFTERSSAAALGMALYTRRIPKEVGSWYFGEYKGPHIKQVMAKSKDDPPRREVANAILADLGFEQNEKNRELIECYWWDD